MFKNKWKALVLGLIAATTSLILVITATTFRTPATAAETNTEQVSSKQIKVTTPSELTDVQPTDWVFQGLQGFIERYGMPVAYPDKTFRGNRDITRGELAQWFQGFTNTIESQQIGRQTGDLATQEDLAALQQSLKSLQKSVQALRQSSPSPRPRI